MACYACFLKAMWLFSIPNINTVVQRDVAPILHLDLCSTKGQEQPVSP